MESNELLMNEVTNYVNNKFNIASEKTKHILGNFVSYPNIEQDPRTSYYPLLFLNSYNFNNISTFNINELSYAFKAGWEFVSINDRIVDSKNGLTPSNLIVSQFFFSEFISTLHNIFEKNSIFWSYHNENFEHFNKSILTEMLKVNYGLDHYSYEEFLFCSANKVAFGKSIIAAIGVLNKDDNFIKSISECHDAFFVANQLLDDIIDYEEDYEAKRYTYIIREALLYNNISEDSFYNCWPTLSEMEELIFSPQIMGRYLCVIEELLDKATLLASSYSINNFIDAIDDLRHRTKSTEVYYSKKYNRTFR